MLLQLRSTVLVIWWDKLPGLSDLVEEVTEEAMEEAMGEAMEEVDLVIWWDKLPGLLDLVEEAIGEVTKEAGVTREAEEEEEEAVDIRVPEAGEDGCKVPVGAGTTTVQVRIGNCFRA